MSKYRDLGPWLEYFGMLRQNEQEGFLQTEAAKHEAYVTQPALYAMTPGDNPAVQVAGGALFATLRRIRTYCAWQHANTLERADYDPKTASDTAAPPPPLPGKALLRYEREPFALHVVQPDAPHDLICTILVSRQRRWFWPFWRLERIEVINY